MKMIIAIIRDEDNETVTHALIAADFRVTRVASTGGFLRRGNSTLIIGVNDDKVDAAIGLVKANTSVADDPAVRRATLFVLDVKDFNQI